MSRRWDITQLKCRAIEMSSRWDVAQLGGREIEMARIKNVAQMDVAQMGCRADGMSR